MSLVGDNNNVRTKYYIPDSIKKNIPDYFYYALAGELVSIFGPWILLKQSFPEFDDDGDEIQPLTEGDRSYYDLNISSGGWYEAFIATCRKLDMMWLVEYWKKLSWYDEDVFNSEIESEIIERFCKVDVSQQHANCYYKYLSEVTRQEREDMENEKTN